MPFRLPHRFRLLTLLAAVGVVAAIVGVYVNLQPGEVERSLRSDLDFPESTRLRTLEFSAIPTEGRWEVREEAIIVAFDGGRFDLMLAYREPRSPSGR